MNAVGGQGAAAPGAARSARACAPLGPPAPAGARTGGSRLGVGGDGRAGVAPADGPRARPGGLHKCGRSRRGGGGARGRLAAGAGQAPWRGVGACAAAQGPRAAGEMGAAVPHGSAGSGGGARAPALRGRSGPGVRAAYVPGGARGGCRALLACQAPRALRSRRRGGERRGRTGARSPSTAARRSGRPSQGADRHCTGEPFMRAAGARGRAGARLAACPRRRTRAARSARPVGVERRERRGRRRPPPPRCAAARSAGIQPRWMCIGGGWGRRGRRRGRGGPCFQPAAAAAHSRGPRRMAPCLSLRRWGKRKGRAPRPPPGWCGVAPGRARPCRMCCRGRVGAHRAGL
jgi:hypothetical protein